MQYDNFGRQTQLNDPDAGTMTYAYDELDRLISQTDAQNHTYSMTYDPLGRMLTKTGPEGTCLYQYDTKPYGVGQLASVTGFNGINADFNYDNFSRLQSKTETINNQNYTFSYQYNYQNQLSQITFPSGFSLKYLYNNFGYQTQIINNNNNSVIWEALSRNHYDQVEQSKTIGFPQSFMYNNLGHLINESYYLSFPYLILNTYSLDVIRNNITSRIIQRHDYLNTEYLHALKDDFTYDITDRLVNTTTYKALPHQQVSIPITQLAQQTTLNYDANGNILSHSNIGNYIYDPVKTHAVKRIENPTPDILNKPTQNITYTAFLQPDKITEDNYELQYIYAYDHQRRISELRQNGNTIKKIIYQDNYEEITVGAVTYTVHYVYSPDRLVAMVVKYDSAGTNYEKIYGVITERQGSILALYNAQGNVVYETSYDAWGRERDVKDGGYTISNNVKPVWLIRGYTGHEHLPEFGLINMNGRLYDPMICRMLSPDNFIQDATSTQGYNRYTYVLNNPLKYKDPSGEFITWSLNKNGGSIGVNFTPVGIPLGFGVNAGWGNGFSVGVYVEVAYRVGGTGIGAGIGYSQSLDYNFKYNSLSTTGTAFAYGSYFIFNASINGSFTYNFKNQTTNWGWGISAGVGFGDEEYGIGLYVGYGSGGFSYGIGGYYDPSAVKIYESPISDNYGKQNGECALRCLEEFSESYGYNQYDFEYWKEQNSGNLGVNPNNLTNIVNNTEVFRSEEIRPNDINNITNALSENKRVMVGVQDINTGKGHAVMVEKVKVYRSGNYKIYYAETSPIRIVPRVSYNMVLINNQFSARYFSFYVR